MKSINKIEYAIGIDLGGTNIKAAVCTSDGKVLGSPLSFSTEGEKGPEYVIKRINQAISHILLLELYRTKVHAIGIGAPGSVDYKRGHVLHPPNLPGWKNVALARIISQRWNLPVKIENDANAAALGEAHFGAGKNLDSFIGITIGTGIGSGIIMERKVVHGERGYAGELGHTKINYNGPKCNCGSYGCVEAYIGNNYLVQRTAVELKHHPSSRLFSRVIKKKITLTPKEIADAARHGDAFAFKILFDAGEKLGIALANAANFLDITTFVIGGGIAAAGKPLMDGIVTGTKKNVLATFRRRINILPSQLGNNAGMLGAAALWF